MFYNFFRYFSGAVDSRPGRLFWHQYGSNWMIYYFATKSVLLTQRKCRTDFGRSNVANRMTTQRLVAKFRETGSVADAHKDRSGWHCSAIIPGNIQNLNTVIYQQDEAPPNLWNSLAGIFLVIDSFRVTPNSLGRPPYSPDLNPCDCFLCGTSRKGSMKTIPIPWQIWRTT